MYLIASVCVRYINVEKITTENQLKYASYFTTMQNYHFYSCYICIRILHTEDIFFSGITTKFCNSIKKIPFHWPKLVFYTQRLITLIKPVFKHRLCKKTFYKNVYTVNLPIRYAKKRNGQRSNFTLMTGIEKFYRYTYHIAPGITYNVHNMIRSPTIECPSKIIRYT